MSVVEELRQDLAEAHEAVATAVRIGERLQTTVELYEAALRAIVNKRPSECGDEVVKRGGHWHVVTESGASLANFGSTPSDQRFRRNAITQLRRRGIVTDDFR